MNINGSQRGGGRQMGLHLLNTNTNDHVEVYEVSGFVADDVLGAFYEGHAISKATKCKQFMYSSSFNPPPDKTLSTEKFIDAIDRTGKKLGLDGQPRVIVFHEKEGRRHAHCVWMRVDAEKMTAINMGNDHYKLKSMAKELFIENKWDIPKGYIDYNLKDPYSFTRAEWERAQKTGRKPKEIIEAIQDAWAISDNRASLEHALKERGFILARGNKGRLVTVDHYGEVYALARKTGLSKADIEKKLGDVNQIPDVDKTKEEISNRLTNQFSKYLSEQRRKQIAEFKPLRERKNSLTLMHRQERLNLKQKHQERWQKEEIIRASKVRKGFKGLWDKLTGSHQRTIVKNEKETQKNRLRDNKENDVLITNQLSERRELQKDIQRIRETHANERNLLFKSMNKHFVKLEKQEKLRKIYEDEIKTRPTIDKDQEPDIEPEI